MSTVAAVVGGCTCVAAGITAFVAHRQAEDASRIASAKSEALSVLARDSKPTYACVRGLIQCNAPLLQASDAAVPCVVRKKVTKQLSETKNVSRRKSSDGEKQSHAQWRKEEEVISSDVDELGKFIVWKVKIFLIFFLQNSSFPIILAKRSVFYMTMWINCP